MRSELGTGVKGEEEGKSVEDLAEMYSSRSTRALARNELPLASRLEFSV